VNPVSLAGRRALVVGASRGIGAAVASRLAADGAAVAAVARNAGDLAAVVDRLPGEGHSTHALDLTLSGDRNRLVEQLGPGPVDIVVSGLRVRRPWQRLDSLDPDSLGSALAENTGYLAHLIAALVPGQRARGFGRWIVLSSSVAALGGEGQGAYVAQKAALEGLVRTLALEEGRFGITANVVAAGFVSTEGTDGAYAPEVRDALGRANALGRPGRADEVAHVVSMLADPRCGFVTGATVPVSGGTELGWAIGAAVRAARDTSAASQRGHDGAR
jgi:NAD(P)-dependent dehydrogenase (short-subunit alcohol dehydrogenase family)